MEQGLGLTGGTVVSATSKGTHKGLAVGRLNAGAFLPDFYRNHVKRPVDVLVSAAALIACLPLFIAVCALIMLETPGSPMFKQKRIGKGGTPFDIYKLRTMYEGADRQGFKTDRGDPRVTRLGNFLRETKIDELPQLWNILCGEMSLIGPRPLSVDESDFVMTELGCGLEHPGFFPSVSPGCTGLEQIYRIHPLVYSERFQWNAYYESKLSFLMDLKILYATTMMCRLVCLATICGGIIELAWIASILVR